MDINISARHQPGTSPGRPERPILSLANDLLERGGFIRRLTDALIAPETAKATEVVIGITGPWGSGKSSILNLLSENIKSRYEHAVVVRFDPWLISGRTDLITEFMSELIATIQSDSNRKAQLKAVTKTIAKYGEHLAPLASTWLPLLGPIIKSGSDLIKQAQKDRESLSKLRARLVKELSAISTPIIVLIDEIDRVEDDEIRCVAQLVRSIADLPSISYVLAYDPKRVVQALGHGVAESERDERGRAYLEKIVQLQVPLPVTFDDEIVRLLNSEISPLQSELRIPANFASADRYQQLLRVVVPNLIHTPRDVSRTVGTFHALYGMLRGEVDWIDLLAYCILLVKAPQTIDTIRQKPDEFSSDVLSEIALARRMDKKEDAVQRLQALIPRSENTEGVRELVGFLFPLLSDESTGDKPNADQLHLRRPLLTTIRLGIIPGGYSRENIFALVSQSRADMVVTLQSAFENKKLEPLLSRFEDLYGEIEESSRIYFWQAAGDFLKKPDCQWLTSYNPMHEVVQLFAEILERAAARDKSIRPHALKVYSNLRNADEDELTAHWIHRHKFVHGVMGREKRGGDAWFLDAEQTIATGKEMANKWRAQHVGGTLIPCRWDLLPVYTMVDLGLWDDQCKQVLEKALDDHRAFDGFVLLLFGGRYSTEKDLLDKIWSYDAFMSRVRSRLIAPDLDDTVRSALRKARGDW